MFEKEAEEYLIRNLCKTCLTSKTFFTICENNCAHAESKKRAYKDGAEFGYNKANEWHYIKDRDLPKEKGVYLTYRKNGLQLLAFDGAYWVTGVQDDMYNTIIAWKEIVLPKESK